MFNTSFRKLRFVAIGGGGDDDGSRITSSCSHVAVVVQRHATGSARSLLILRWRGRTFAMANAVASALVVALTDRGVRRRSGRRGRNDRW